jgi:hypothetical protein
MRATTRARRLEMQECVSATAWLTKSRIDGLETRRTDYQIGDVRATLEATEAMPDFLKDGTLRRFDESLGQTPPEAIRSLDDFQQEWEDWRREYLFLNLAYALWTYRRDWLFCHWPGLAGVYERWAEIP